MITAEEARKISDSKYHSIYNNIERIARNGGHKYEYNTLIVPMEKDLYDHLIANGYKIVTKEEVTCDEDHYGKIIRGTERTIYHNIISW
jgi:hypothetical protein